MRVITRSKAVLFFFLLNVPAAVLYLAWPQGLRLYTISLAFVAMWSLWVARRERKHLWTPKLHDIWTIQFLWCIAAVEGNLELFYRHARPSVGILLVCGALALTIKGVFNGEKYTLDQT